MTQRMNDSRHILHIFKDIVFLRDLIAFVIYMLYEQMSDCRSRVSILSGQVI
jgi:hypothetical protein